jgi:CIC family chloride channel protein
MLIGVSDHKPIPAVTPLSEWPRQPRRASAPLTAAVLAFELSGDYPIVLPLIVATVVPTSLSRGLGGLSIYEAELQRKGVHWTVSLDGRQIRKGHKLPRSGS